MWARLAIRHLTLRKGRSLLLLAGYGIGVAVMIVLLSIGEALLAQARDEKLVGGGDITVLPEGIDVEVMKTGGLGGMYFSIDHARFVFLQLLGSPRLAPHVAAVAPQIEGTLLYLRTRDGRELPVRATGEIPSASRALGALPAIAEGAWRDDEGDRRWIAPTPVELRHDIDHFHLPPASLDADARRSWAEWHYFNVLSADARRWAFVTLMVGGDIPEGEWGGQTLVTLREEGKGERRFATQVPSRAVNMSTTRADLDVGDSRVRVLDDGRYELHAVAREVGGSARARIDLVVTPVPRAYFPGAALGGQIVSGYAVPALRAGATGTVCVDSRCERYDDAQSYHDHNWGTWAGVTWEWGAARAGAYTFLYGRVEAPDAEPGALFLYVVDSLGFRALFRPSRIDYDDGRTIRVGGQEVRVPRRAVMADVRGADTIRITLDVEDAIGSDVRTTAERGSATTPRPYFIQMKGRATLGGRLAGRELGGSGYGFFETYRGPATGGK
ncbi:MAG TPA: ABC transporter permease [Gemmatimonadaceae bacterium]|nr:ABC transporter permease [Gemmatimonadaceae bacterium]